MVRQAPVTCLLIAAVVVVWLASEVLPGRVAVRHALGSSSFDIARGQWWRLFTPTFLNTPDASGRIHTTAWQHLLFNLLPLVLVGPRVERILGRARFVALWVVGELLGRAWLAFIFPFDRSFQGGTSIFAVGALQATALADALLHRRRSPAERRYIFVFAAVVLIEIVGAQGAGRGNNNAHLAGVLAGLFLVGGAAVGRARGSTIALSLTAAVALALAGFHTSELRRTSRQLEASVAVGSRPYYLAAGAGALWVSNYGDGTVTRVDPKTNRVAATIPLGGSLAAGITVADGLVWVVNSPTSLVAVDPALNRVARRVVVPDDASDVAFGSGSLWVSSVGANVVTRLDPAQGTVLARIRVAPRPFEVDADASSVWVESYDAARLTRIDPATNRAVQVVKVDRWANDVAIGRSGVWVSARETERVSRDGQSTIVSRSPRSDVFQLIATGDQAWGTRDNTVVRFDANAAVVVRRRLGLVLSSGVVVTDGSVWVTDVAGGRLLRVAS